MSEGHTQKTPRRQRSDMTLDECHAAVAVFASRIQRMGQTSGGGMFSEFAPAGQNGIHLLIVGTTFAPNRWFEAMWVLGGKKLPSKAESLQIWGYTPDDLQDREVLLSECCGQGSGPGWRLLAPLKPGGYPMQSIKEATPLAQKAFRRLKQRNLASLEHDKILRIRLWEGNPEE